MIVSCSSVSGIIEMRGFQDTFYGRNTTSQDSMNTTLRNDTTSSCSSSNGGKADFITVSKLG